MAAGVLTNLVAVLGPTSLTISADTDVATGSLYMVGVLAGADAPDHDQIVAGTDAADAPAVFADTQAAASTTTFSPAETGLPRSTAYDVYVTQVNGAAEASTPITEEFSTTAAAILASIAQAQFGVRTMLVTVVSDLPDGVLYVVLTASTTPPSAAQVIAGQNNAGAAAPWATFVTPDESLTSVLVAAGLTAATAYWAYAVQVVDEDNSNVADSSTSTTTKAAGGPSFVQPLMSGVYS